MNQVVVAQSVLELVTAEYFVPGGCAPLLSGSGLAAVLAATSPIFPPLGLVIVLPMDSITFPVSYVHCNRRVDETLWM